MILLWSDWYRTMFAMFQYMLLKPTIAPTGGQIIPYHSLSGAVEFNSVKFTYPTRPQQTVLNNFNLHIPAGRVVALVGLSGSGQCYIAWFLADCTAGSLIGYWHVRLSISAMLCIVAKRYILQQKGQNKWIGNAWLGTWFYNFQPPTSIPSHQTPHAQQWIVHSELQYRLYFVVAWQVVFNYEAIMHVSMYGFKQI